MDYIKKHINGILGTVLFHLLIIIFALSLKLNTMNKDNETYLLITPEYFEEIEKEELEEEMRNKDIDNVEIERFITEIHNRRLDNNKSQAYEQESMSQEELKRMYEEEFLREKHGDDYEKIKNSTYEDYYTKSENSQTNDVNKQTSNKSNQVISETGIVLVEYKLDNENRKAIDLYVPSYKCKGGGKVVIKISVRQDGSVRSASVLSKDKNASDNECILNSAKSAALKSKFSSSSGAAIDNGTITYIFVSQ